MPVLLEAAANLQSVSDAVAASGKPTTEVVIRAITRSAATIELFEGRVAMALEKVYGVHTDYKAAFKADQLIPQLQAFRELALSGQSDSATLTQKGTEVIEGLSSLQIKMIDRLDELLQVRVDGLARQRTLTMTVVSIALLLGSYLFYAFYLVTQGGLNEVERHLVAMTSGDLTSQSKPMGQR